MKVPARFRLFYYLFFFLFPFFFPFQLVASEYVFSDDFTSINEVHWNVIQNPGGSVSILENNYLKLSAPTGNFFPYVQLRNIQIPESDYSIELRFKLSGQLNYGTGIVFSDKLIPNGTAQDLTASDVIFQIWPISTSQVGIWTTQCKKELANCINGSYSMLTSISLETWNTITITETANHYVVSINGNSYETRDSSRKITNMWLGNPQRTITPVIRASVLVDDFRISTLSKSKSPIIILPGLGASWDTRAILSNLPGSEWTIPPYIQNYDSLIKSLENAGYEKNKDLFIFAHDWRKPLDRLADDLKSFIENKNLGSEKIDFIGHSMGGLVARTYAQKHGLDNVNRIITAGSPNLGTPLAYGTWEGGEVWKDNFWQAKLGIEILSLNTLSGETKVDTIRRVVPSIRDLLPTYDFLSFDGFFKPWVMMNQKNTYLSSLNQSLGSLNEKLTVLYGVSHQTADTIFAQERTSNDAVLGLWEDGKPVEQNSIQTTDGDDTVTVRSAIGVFDNKISIPGTHFPLLADRPGLEAVFDTLGLDKSNIEILPMGSFNFFNNAFAAILKSPGRLEVCNSANKCNSDLGIYYPEEKLFILPGYKGEKLATKVIDNGERGAYKLYIGSVTDQANWVENNGTLEGEGEIDFYGSGNDGEDFSVVFDNVPPEIVITSPSHGYYRSVNLPPVNYSVTDNWDDNPLSEISGWSNEEGVHKFSVKGTDRAGNSASKSVDFTVDNTPPEIVISSPIGKTYNPYEIPELIKTVSDNFDPEPSVEVTGFSQEEGAHTLTVTATDKAGNVGVETVDYIIVLDKEPPKIVITSPEAKTYQSDTLPNLAYTINDDWDSSPSASVSGWTNVEGEHVVTVEAKDKAGNLAIATLKYQIQNPPNHKDLCKNNRWRNYRLLRFRNQGECVSFVERHERVIKLLTTIIKLLRR